ncbi:hypothetical protein Cflav_PD2303 [Pedosphaera parvula Ellin514]|uniref:Uncharacterized protein n=1 Tax=Pedosphaera parvula (strain Ellin514) TaxID=320771 RepID=B9XKW5_PEDPL|nr:hypothetical protein Cflav_PD2303 [Pedosphaera parvula Ellin514]
MARKAKITRFVKEVRVPEKAPVRRQASKPAGLYLLELRSHVAKAQSSKGRKLISIELKEGLASKARTGKVTKL